MKTFIFLIAFIFSNHLLAKNIFDEQGILEVTLTYDISKLQSDKENLRENGLQGTFQTTTRTYPIEIMARGKGSFHCQQPQLKLKFNKKENKKTLFKDLKKVKLFTRGTCLRNITSSPQDREIISNYLTYKLYEQMTPYHFKTRLFKITYIDTSNKYESYTQYGFFLEPKKFIQKRLNLKYIEEESLWEQRTTINERMHSKTLGLVNSFEFFVANYDYGIPGFYSHIINDGGYSDIIYVEKNSKLYQDENGNIYPFIYDFDFSRFIQLSDSCFMVYRFFTSRIVSGDNCNPNKVKKEALIDLNDFHYKKDYKSNHAFLMQSFLIWRSQHKKVFSLLGPGYQESLEVFEKAFSNLFD